jgi:gamma-glutamyltranspeptidase/glutathione hydrolase
MVMGTFTIQAGMGCHVVPGELGFIMNNSLSYFSLDPRSPNVVAPRKRPEWPMPNIMVTKDDKILLALGAPGGHGITQTVPQTLINMIEFGMDIQSAIEAPRFRLFPEYRSYPDRGVSMVIRPETRIPSAVFRALEARGHTIEPYNDWGPGVGNMSGIMVHPMSGVYMAGADPRGSYAALAW